MAGEMVTVGCKAPNGLVLNLHRYVRADENPSSNRVRRMDGQVFTLHGWAHSVMKPDPAETTGGYRLNQVPADFWAEWFKRNADSPLIKDGVILPPPTKGGIEAATDKALDHEAVPKMFRPVTEKDAFEVSRFTKDG